MTRAEAIEILKKLIEAMQGHVTVLPTPERIAAIRLAIASLETDEAYQLEYEKPTTKNDLGVDAVSRQQAIERLKLNFPISDGADNSRDRHRYMQALADIQAIRELPSVTPQEPFINKPCVSEKQCEHDKNNVLDKLRAELHANAEMHEDGDYYLRDEWIDEILDKYKAETEAEDG